MSTLYNKHSPQIFNDVVGQKMAITVLKAIIHDASKINGIIFSGIHGIGKTLLARIFARAINCTEKNQPCNKCKSCVSLLQKHSDVLEIDGATYTGVDNIRQVLEDTNYLPIEHKYKIYIIDEVHMLSRSAFDALLMTLHEPPEYVKFIFATTRPDKLPDTFVSRCTSLPLNNVGEIDIVGNLQRICQLENITINVEVLKIIANAAEFSVRSSISLLELIILIDVNIKTEEVLDYLKIFSIKDCVKIITLVLDGLPSEAISVWSQFKKKGYDEQTFFHQFVKVLSNLSLIKLDNPVENEEIYREILNKYNLSFNLLINFWEIIISQTEALYNGGYSLVETTIIMISLIEDRTDLVREAKKAFPTLFFYHNYH